MNKFVFVVVINGMWDFEQTNDCIVFNNFEKAYNKYLEQVKLAKADMSNFVDEEDIRIEENGELNGEDTKYLGFSIYESGDYTRNHCDISLSKTEVL